MPAFGIVGRVCDVLVSQQVSAAMLCGGPAREPLLRARHKEDIEIQTKKVMWYGLEPAGEYLFVLRCFGVNQ